MKIPTIEQIRACDTYTIEHEPVSSINLMERAAKACVNHIEEMFPNKIHIAVICGMGNNGGDGLAITRLLLDKNCDCHAFLIKHNDSFSSDCEENCKRLQNNYPSRIQLVHNEEEIPSLKHYDLVVDALLGSGLNKPIEKSGLLSKMIKTINDCPAFIFAVDIPSGLFAEKPMGEPSVAIEADFTLSFQFPKLCFFFPENYQYAGEWNIADIGLNSQCIHQMESSNNMVDNAFIRGLLRVRKKFSHKGNFGHGLLIAGSKGMMGAAVLASKSCLRAGIGLLTTHIPLIGYFILQTTVPEAMIECDENENHFSGIEFKTLDKYNAVGIGSGLGKEKCSAEGLKKLIGDFGGPIVFDADAINILAENKTWLEFIPPNCIFTPHIKEFERLTHPVSNSFERMELQKEFSKRYNCIVVLKGAHTCVSSPQGNCYFNTSGNPGMATAGSGDVLTGIILSLLAQEYSSFQTAIIGVYLHGKAADIALQQQSYESLIASDIVENLGKAFQMTRG
jgi:NAD(P)H-hydrate epimerase